MGTKLSNLSELSNILIQKERADEGILTFSKQLKIGHLLKPFSSINTQGYSLMFILVALVLSRFREMRIRA